MDAGAAFEWAQSYFAFGDFVNARKWYARRIEFGGSGEELYCAMHRLAVSMHKLGEPWPDIQDAYLRAWASRPSRAEPLYAIATQHRNERHFQLGYLFARRAAAIPYPESDHLAVDEDVYTWRAVDEQAVCGAWIGQESEALALSRHLVSLTDIPDETRRRIAKNRDFSVAAMLESAATYPEALVNDIAPGSPDAEVTVSLITSSDRDQVERTLNSFLNCCRDVRRVGRFVAVDTGLSAGDRRLLQERYAFVEFIDPDIREPAHVQLRRFRAEVKGRFWLHLGNGWQFFTPEDLVTRLTAVLEAETQVFQVGINFDDAVKLTGACAVESTVRRAPGTGRYVLTGAVAVGPAMFDTARLDSASGITAAGPNLLSELRQAGLQTAALDEVLCVSES